MTWEQTAEVYYMFHTFRGGNLPPTNILSLSNLVTENFNFADLLGKKTMYSIGK